MKMDLKH